MGNNGTKKVIAKDALDEIMRLTRKYHKTGDTDILPALHGKAEELSKQTFGSPMKWLAICDLVGSALGGNGLKNGAPNSTIYRLFEVLGYAVGDEDRTETEQDAKAIEALEKQLAEEQRIRRNAVNELCQKCGRYREEHNGACDGCRWHHAKA